MQRICIFTDRTKFIADSYRSRIACWANEWMASQDFELQHRCLSTLDGISRRVVRVEFYVYVLSPKIDEVAEFRAKNSVLPMSYWITNVLVVLLVYSWLYFDMSYVVSVSEEMKSWCSRIKTAGLFKTRRFIAVWSFYVVLRRCLSYWREVLVQSCGDSVKEACQRSATLTASCVGSRNHGGASSTLTTLRTSRRLNGSSKSTWEFSAASD